MANWSTPSTSIHVPGIEPNDMEGAANAINRHLASICQALNPLDCSKLPSYLPATPPPQVKPLKRVKVSKAPGPNKVLKVIKEFAYELSKPLSDILNASLRDFVSGRKQRVRYQGALSDWEYLTCGVAQGTLLGPLVFLAMINDIEPVSTNSHWKYVDDFNLGEIKPELTTSTLQSNLDNLERWSTNNSMMLNPKKCKAMHFCFMRQSPQLPSLTLGGESLSIVTQSRLLGLHIRSDLRWDDQVNEMVSKSSKRLFLISKLRRSGVPASDLTTIYCGYIRPILEYGAPSWSSALTNIHSAALERVQKRACKLILGRQYISYSETLTQLDLQRLSTRRQGLCTDFAMKVENSPRFCSWLPPRRGELNSRPLRNSKQLVGTKRYRTSAIPALVDLLNELQ
ncbi:hypothetical protein Bbelb_290870 [Branchiostoma belcheri]|nr:hypothetical protein Bbelb_290870 [Branchiostoma belcheri]